MKKQYTMLLAAIGISAGLVTGCGKGYDDVERTTVFIESSGKITLTEVEAFDETKYDKNDLLGFVSDAVTNYNAEAGSKKVELKKMVVKKNSALLMLEFVTPEDFSAFTGYSLQITTTDALTSAGISLEGDFVKVGSKCETEFARSSQFLEGKPLHVAIVTGDFDVCIPKNLQFLSADGAVIDDRKVITLDDSSNILDAMSDSTGEDTKAEEAKAEQADESGEEADGNAPVEAGESASNGSISADELLAFQEATETDEEVYVYEEQPVQTADSAYNHKRVYIVYK